MLFSTKENTGWEIYGNFNKSDNLIQLVMANTNSIIVGSLKYSVKLSTAQASGTVNVSLVDKEGKVVATGAGTEGELTVPNAKLWWPFTMVKNDSDAGYLYTLMVININLKRCYEHQK